MAGMWTERLCASKLLLADKTSLVVHLRRVFFVFFWFFFGQVHQSVASISVAKARFIFFCPVAFVSGWRHQERILRENGETFYIKFSVSE